MDHALHGQGLSQRLGSASAMSEALKLTHFYQIIDNQITRGKRNESFQKIMVSVILVSVILDSVIPQPPLLLVPPVLLLLLLLPLYYHPR